MEKDRKAVIFNVAAILASLFIILSGPLISHTLIYLLVQAFGILLIVWAIITIKMTKHEEHLPPGYFFLTKGPYEILRHPIYAGYLLIMVSFAETEFTFLRLIALVVLVVMIMLKVVREEYTMKEKVKAYQDYMKKTKALIPYLL